MQKKKLVVVNREIKATVDTLQNRNRHYILKGYVMKEIESLEE